MTFITEHKKAFGNLPDDIINKITNLLDLEPSDFTRIETHLYWSRKFSKIRREYVFIYEFFKNKTNGLFLKKTKNMISLSYHSYGEFLGEILDSEYISPIGDTSWDFYDDYHNQIGDICSIWNKPITDEDDENMSVQIYKKLGVSRVPQYYSDKRRRTNIDVNKTHTNIFNETLINMKKLYTKFLLYFSYYDENRTTRPLKNKIIKLINKDIDKINLFLSHFNRYFHMD